MTKIILNQHEVILKEALANHFYEIEACGGKIYLTNHRLFFKTHVLNINDHELTIEFQQIERVELCRTLLIVPNGLRIILKSGKKEQFVIGKRSEWKTAIEEVVQKEKKA